MNKEVCTFSKDGLCKNILRLNRECTIDTFCSCFMLTLERPNCIHITHDCRCDLHSILDECVKYKHKGCICYTEKDTRECRHLYENYECEKFVTPVGEHIKCPHLSMTTRSILCKHYKPAFLKPNNCPCCGKSAGTVLFSTYGNDNGIVTHYSIKCTNCHMITARYNTEEEAIEAWNKRTK